MDAHQVHDAQQELGQAYRQRRLIAQLQAKRAEVLRAWARQADFSDGAWLDPNQPLERMWRLTYAIDRAIVRAGGEV